MNSRRRRLIFPSVPWGLSKPVVLNGAGRPRQLRGPPDLLPGEKFLDCEHITATGFFKR
jgi:hypothetical protein